MKSLKFISLLIIALVWFSSCSKIEPFAPTTTEADSDGVSIFKDGGEDDSDDVTPTGKGDVVDPDEDEDMDVETGSVVDPDEDEDMDVESVVDPDEDEDMDVETIEEPDSDDTDSSDLDPAKKPTSADDNTGNDDDSSNGK